MRPSRRPRRATRGSRWRAGSLRGRPAERLPAVAAAGCSSSRVPCSPSMEPSPRHARRPRRGAARATSRTRRSPSAASHGSGSGSGTCLLSCTGSDFDGCLDPFDSVYVSLLVALDSVPSRTPSVRLALGRLGLRPPSTPCTSRSWSPSTRPRRTRIRIVLRRLRRRRQLHLGRLLGPLVGPTPVHAPEALQHRRRQRLRARHRLLGDRVRLQQLRDGVVDGLALEHRLVTEVRRSGQARRLHRTR